MKQKQVQKTHEQSQCSFVCKNLSKKYSYSDMELESVNRLSEAPSH